MIAHYGDTLQDPSDAAREARIELSFAAQDEYIETLRNRYPDDTELRQCLVVLRAQRELILQLLKEKRPIDRAASRQPITTEQAKAWFDPGVPLPAALDNLHTTTP